MPLADIDTRTLSGDLLHRLRQSLQIARQQAQAAHAGGYGRRVDDALTETEEAITAELARLAAAVSDDQADAEESGAAEQARQNWFPRYRAA
jgi:hypothetical protein